MLQPMNGLQYAQSGFNRVTNNMAARQTAVQMFDKVYSTAQRKKLFSGLMGRSRNLQHLQAETLPTNSAYGGTHDVRLEHRCCRNRGLGNKHLEDEGGEIHGQCINHRNAK